MLKKFFILMFMSIYCCNAYDNLIKEFNDYKDSNKAIKNPVNFVNKCFENITSIKTDSSKLLKTLEIYMNLISDHRYLNFKKAPLEINTPQQNKHLDSVTAIMVYLDQRDCKEDLKDKFKAIAESNYTKAKELLDDNTLNRYAKHIDWVYNYFWLKQTLKKIEYKDWNALKNFEKPLESRTVLEKLFQPLAWKNDQIDLSDFYFFVKRASLPLRYLNALLPKPMKSLKDYQIKEREIEKWTDLDKSVVKYYLETLERFSLIMEEKPNYFNMIKEDFHQDPSDYDPNTVTVLLSLASLCFDDKQEGHKISFKKSSKENADDIIEFYFEVSHEKKEGSFPNVSYSAGTTAMISTVPKALLNEGDYGF